MKIEFTGRGFEINDDLRDFTRGKLERVMKHLDHIRDVHVVLSVEKYRHRAEMTFHSLKRKFHGTEETNDMRSAIDRVAEKLEAQVRKQKEKQTTKKRNTTETIRANAGAEVVLPIEAQADQDFKVVRSRRPVQPMNLDEALDELEKLNQDFVIFRDADSERINVVYRRKDGHIGLIDPPN